MIPITKVFQVKVDDISGTTRKQIQNTGVKFKKGSRIAVTAGSRGIANIAAITKAAVDEVQSQGALPFIIPAMGSHGGATAERAKEVLEHYGIMEETMRAPIISAMDVVSIPNEDNDFKLYMSRYAYEADGVIVINRVKPIRTFMVR